MLIVPFMVTADDEIWSFQTPLGKAQLSERNPDILIFHTFEAMTIAKDKRKAWDQTKGYEKDITEKAKDLHDRLYKLEDVAAVAITYRSINIQKFPLTSWDDLLPRIEGILK
jgi:hypothetical protein